MRKLRAKKTKFRFEQSADGSISRLYLYDDVTAYGDFNWETWEYDESETSADYFRKKLDEIPETGTIELHVNSYGGDVKEGVAIYNLLKQHKAQKVCYVDGFAYSIASVVCLACDKIVMGLGTSMLIHNMAMSVYGDARMLRKCADDLDVLMESNRKIYMERAKGLTEEQLAEMMDAETFLTPQQCLEYGFCDEIAEKQADQTQIARQAMKEIAALRQQIGSMQTFRQEMRKLEEQAHPGASDMGVPDTGQPDPVQRHTKEQHTKEPYTGQKESSRKALKMAGAFLNTFSKGGAE